MRRLLSSGLAAIFLLPILSCSSMIVRTDHDTQRDFSAYSGFAMYERPGGERSRAQMSPLVDQRIAASISSELRVRGFGSATPRDADLLVTFYTNVQRRVVVRHHGWYGWGRWGWHGGPMWVDSFPEGTLIIDIIDRRDRQLVWRGVGQGAFSKPNPSDDVVAKRVGKILRDFPPMR